MAGTHRQLLGQTDKIFTCLSDREKHLLITKYDELAFVDEIADLLCGKCEKVAIHHTESECKHLFCKTCTNQLRKSSHSKCPKCGKHLEIRSFKNNPEIENRVSKLKAYCFNAKNGCPEIQSLRQLSKHFSSCKFNERTEALTPMDRTSSTQNLLIPAIKQIQHIIPQQLNQLDAHLQAKLIEQGTNLENKLISSFKELENKLECGLAELKVALENQNRLHQHASSLVNNENKVKTAFKKEVNILLVGEFGTGKSTIINSFANCVRYRSFEEAENGEKTFLIPNQFSLMDEDYNDRIVTVGNEDSNESFEEEQPHTRSCKTYLFALNEHLNIRWIDSRGFSSDSEEDARSIYDIISCLSRYEHLDAIAIVLNPNQARQSSNFEHCLRQILGNIHSSAAHNFLFIFTHCNKPGDTMQVLKSTLNQNFKSKFRSSKEIQFSKTNTFCFENETFKHLMALKSDMSLDSDDHETSRSNWGKNMNTFRRLINYILTLRPHFTFNTNLIHQQKTLADDVMLILQCINKNILQKDKKLEIDAKMEIEKKALDDAFQKIQCYINNNVILCRKNDDEETNKSKIVTENDIIALKKKLFLLEIYGSKFKGLCKIEKSGLKAIKNDNEIVIAYENNTFDSIHANNLTLEETYD